MNKKKLVRSKFREAVFTRDKNKCRVCKKPDENMDAHHITSRDSMPNGGYVKENGISLCSECHISAELEYFGVARDPEYSTEKLYELIGSSEELAIRASERLSKGCLETIAQSSIVLFQWVRAGLDVRKLKYSN